MSIPTTLFWPSSVNNLAAIAPLQDTSGVGNLGLLSMGPFVMPQMARTVALTSANNLAARTFTINGISAAVDGTGNPAGPFVVFSEAIAGPNANTVYTARIYKSITFISVDGAVVGISAGYGTSGITSYVFNDYNRSAWYASVQVQPINRTALTFAVYQSLTKPENINIALGNLTAYPNPIPAFAVIAAGATTNQLVQLPMPVTIVWATIAANTGNNEQLYLTLLQQGLRS